MKDKKEVIHDYNGRDYRTVWQKPRAEFEDIFETGLTKKLVSNESGWFIDIGAGYGRVLPTYRKPERKIVLVDYAMNLLEIAQGTYSKEKDVYFVAANAYHLPFKKDVFRGGVSIRTFHHMNLADKFISEVGRVTHGGSSVMMEYANKRNLFRIFKHPVKSLQRDHEEYEPLLYGTHPSYFKKISEDADFKVVKTLGTGFFPRFITDRTLFLIPILKILEIIFDNTFGRLRLAPMNFVEIKKNAKSSEDKKKLTLSEINDILQCPVCGGDLDNSQKDKIVCRSCKKVFPKKGNILDLRYNP